MKKAPYLDRHKKDHINKKAMYWIGGVIGVLVIVMAVLIVLNK